MREKYQLLLFHMNCNPDYLFGHAQVAGALATKGMISTFAEYERMCQERGITNYNEECFNDFMQDCGRNTTQGALGLTS